MGLTAKQVDCLLRELEKTNKPFYVFIDEHKGEVDSAWLDDNQQAISYAKAISQKTGNIVNVLRYVGSSQGDVDND